MKKLACRAAAILAKTAALGLAYIGVMVLPAGLMQLAAGVGCLLAAAVVYGIGARLDAAAGRTVPALPPGKAADR